MRHRHALYLSEVMTQRLQIMAETHHLTKSEILERALKRYLASESGAPPTDLLVLQHERNSRSLRRLERDLAIATELMATFVRYFVTITPPLPEGEHAAARALGQLRFEQVIEDIARRLRTDRSLIARVAAILSETPQTRNQTASSRMPAMRHRRPAPSHEPRTKIVGISDLFEYAQRHPPQPADEELWSIRVVRMKTGLSRASVYKYMALGPFPRQRHLGCRKAHMTPDRRPHMTPRLREAVSRRGVYLRGFQPIAACKGLAGGAGAERGVAGSITRADAHETGQIAGVGGP
jgi:hypothetical protein